MSNKIKTKIIILLICCSIAFLFFFLGKANASSYVEDFEDYSQGTYLDDLLYWTCSDERSSIVSTPVQEGSKSLSFNEALYPFPSEPNYSLFRGEDLTTHGTVSIWLRTNATSPRYDGITFFLKNSSQSSLAIVRFAPTTYTEVVEYVSGSTYYSLGNFVPNDWNNLKIEWNSEDSIARYKLNDGEWTSWEPIFGSYSGGYVETLTFTYQRYQNTKHWYIDYIETEDSSVINASCGIDNEESFYYPFTEPENYCDENSQIIPFTWFFSGDSWSWTCKSLTEGENAYCVAYNDTETEVDATCGSDNGEELSYPPVDFCSTGYLAEGSYFETTSGYSWTCAGINGGNYDYCSATKLDQVVYNYPTEDDCSSLSYPDRWYCNISNAIQTAFLPSPEKLNELNEVVSGIKDRFPFSYISIAGSFFKTISENTQETDEISIEILGNEGSISSGFLEDIKEATYIFLSGLLVLGFVFYLIKLGRSILK
jgi:hypothetical protein